MMVFEVQLVLDPPSEEEGGLAEVVASSLAEAQKVALASSFLEEEEEVAGQELLEQTMEEVGAVENERFLGVAPPPAKQGPCQVLQLEAAVALEEVAVEPFLRSPWFLKHYCDQALNHLQIGCRSTSVATLVVEAVEEAW